MCSTFPPACGYITALLYYSSAQHTAALSSIHSSVIAQHILLCSAVYLAQLWQRMQLIHYCIQSLILRCIIQMFFIFFLLCYSDPILHRWCSFISSTVTVVCLVCLASHCCRLACASRSKLSCSRHDNSFKACVRTALDATRFIASEYDNSLTKMSTVICFWRVFFSTEKTATEQ